MFFSDHKHKRENKSDQTHKVDHKETNLSPQGFCRLLVGNKIVSVLVIVFIFSPFVKINCLPPNCFTYFSSQLKKKKKKKIAHINVWKKRKKTPDFFYLFFFNIHTFSRWEKKQKVLRKIMLAKHILLPVVKSETWKENNLGSPGYSVYFSICQNIWIYFPAEFLLCSFWYMLHINVSCVKPWERK